jgi:hypothetical protein
VDRIARGVGKSLFQWKAVLSQLLPVLQAVPTLRGRGAVATPGTVLGPNVLGEMALTPSPAWC